MDPKKKTKKKEQDVEVMEIDNEAVKSIATEVVKGVMPVLEEKVDETLKEKLEAFTAKTEKVVKKDVLGKAKEAEEEDDKKDKKTKKVDMIKDMAQALIALQNGDKETLRDYNKGVLERREKAGYANTGTDADGGYIALDPEFEAEIEKLTEVYGIAFSDANVRSINSNSVKTNKRGSNVTMYETNQAEAKTGTKLTIEQTTVELRKFAAIAIATDELTDDSAIDFWAEVREGFAEERARIADELVFIDDDADYPGIIRTDGIVIEPVGATIDLATWDNLMNAEVSVPTRAMKNGKHYMHRTIWNIFRQAKDDEGRYQIFPLEGLKTPWGTPVELVDAMPTISEPGDGNEGFVVFGDLKRVRLYVKKGLVLTPSKDATVTDADSAEVKLYEQDMTALRAVTRMVVLVKFPEAFCVIGTGTVS